MGILPGAGISTFGLILASDSHNELRKQFPSARICGSQGPSVPLRKCSDRSVRKHRMTQPLTNLVAKFPFAGRLEWIGVRPSTHEPMRGVPSAACSRTSGLEGDRYRGPAGGPRLVTLFQQEHLTIVGQLLRRGPIAPESTRRNLLISGFNLLACKNRYFRIGECVLRGTRFCHPCSKMESTIGPGGYAAMVGHGGLTATVLKEGVLNVGDVVELLPEYAPPAELDDSPSSLTSPRN